jgi:hypothetical protein
MALSSFDSWRDMQEGFMDAMKGTVGGMAQKSEQVVGGGLDAKGSVFSPKPDASAVKNAIMKKLSGVSGTMVQKAMPLVMDLMSQPEKMRAKAMAHIIGALDMDLESIKLAKSEIKRTQDILQKGRSNTFR